MRDVLLSELLKIGLLALAPVGGWLASRVSALISARASASRTALLTARLWEFASSVVAEVEADIRPDLIASLADRKLTRDEGAMLKRQALSRLKGLLAERGLQELVEVLGVVGPRLDEYLGGVIERAVKNTKPREPVFIER